MERAHYIKGYTLSNRRHKGVHPLQLLTQRAALLFIGGGVLDIRVAVKTNPTAPHDKWPSMVHYSSYLHQKDALSRNRPTSWFQNPPLHTAKRYDTSYVLVKYLHISRASCQICYPAGPAGAVLWPITCSNVLK